MQGASAFVVQEPPLTGIHIINSPETLEDDQFIGILGYVHGGGGLGTRDISDYDPVSTNGKVTSDLVISRIVLGAGIQKSFDVAIWKQCLFRDKR